MIHVTRWHVVTSMFVHANSLLWGKISMPFWLWSKSKTHIVMAYWWWDFLMQTFTRFLKLLPSIGFSRKKWVNMVPRWYGALSFCACQFITMRNTINTQKLTHLWLVDRKIFRRNFTVLLFLQGSKLVSMVPRWYYVLFFYVHSYSLLWNTF